jgi:DNA primase
MSIDFDKFLDWAKSRFEDVVVKGNEILLNSIFCDDKKHHLWCNPYGGKTNSENGVYHCWKSESKGSLTGLVMEVEKCTYDQACEILDASRGSLFDLEKKVQEIFDQKYKLQEQEENASFVKGLDLPFGCYLFKDLPSSNKIKTAAEEYLKKRKIDAEGLLVCIKGRYKNRIIIPYYDQNNNLVYYNGRSIGNSNDCLRYLGPPKELGIGKGDVIYCQDWPKIGDKVYITEGEFDSMSLNKCGFKSFALGGKNMTHKQMEVIKNYIPVLCLDADDAGAVALSKIANKLLSSGVRKVFYIRPCVEYKDWNGLLVEKGERILKLYIDTQEKQYNSDIAVGDWESTKLAINNVVK